MVPSSPANTTAHWEDRASVCTLHSEAQVHGMACVQPEELPDLPQSLS